MKLLYCKWIVVSLCFSGSLFFMAGCTLNPGGNASAVKSSVAADGQSVRSPSAMSVNYGPAFENGDRYFYYIEFQRERRNGNLKKAALFLAQAIQADPESVYLKRELAALYLRQRNPEKATELIQQILKAHPDDIEILLLYGKLLQGLKKEDEAREVYEQILKKDRHQKEVYLRLGSIYMDDKAYDNAFRVYRQLVKEYPDSYVGHFFIGKIYAEKRQY